VSLRHHTNPIAASQKTLISLVTLMAVAAVMVLAACSRNDSGATPAAKQVSVVLTEWSVTLSPVTAAAGRVTFNASNSGTVSHKLVILKTDRPIDRLEVKDGRVDEAASGTLVGQVVEFAPNEKPSRTFNLSAGKYVLFCNVIRHYEQGMSAALTVQ
jgi:uncharacterized cupredoxin-like copper-binding protein